METKPEGISGTVDLAECKPISVESHAMPMPVSVTIEGWDVRGYYVKKERLDECLDLLERLERILLGSPVMVRATKDETEAKQHPPGTRIRTINAQIDAMELYRIQRLLEVNRPKPVITMET